jgi:signal transduction histidine kinase
MRRSPYHFITSLIGIFTLVSVSTFSQEVKRVDSISYYSQKINDEKDEISKASLHLQLSSYYQQIDKRELSAASTLKALSIYEKAAMESKVADCNLMLFQTSNLNVEEDSGNKKYIDRYYKHALKNKDNSRLAKAHQSYGIYYWGGSTATESKIHFQKALNYAAKANDSLNWAKISGNLGLYYSGYENKQDSARYLFENEINYYSNHNKYHNLLIKPYINIANSYEKEDKIDKAFIYLKKANDIPVEKNKVFYQKVIFGKYSKYLKLLGNYKEALIYQEKYLILQDSLNRSHQNIAVTELKTKYETEKKEKENAFLKNDIEKKKQTQVILWIVVVLSIITGTAISILISKNAKRKQQLAWQEEQLKIQKIEKNLKEQELNSIDVLIEGQEKERQRLAENLHDNLGGTLAALKLNLQNLQQNQEDKKITKKSVNNSLLLIDDAYQNVRNMAHEKSNGVVASQGLLPALERLANTISSELLNLKVEHFGLKNRLDNSLEIRIFRIIQELVTNIIKHANANEATISLTNHNSTLNIIVEDNGKGFLPNKISKTEGIGLDTIEKRIENLGGTLEIDSYPNKGSSIIINLPL